MIRAMLVTTNDPSTPEFRLEVFGDVRPRAYISTGTVRLTGTAGNELSRIVSISPTPENAFKIVEVKAEKGDNFRFNLEETKNAGIVHYRLTVFNTKKDKGWYIDKIVIKTDSEISPVFEVRVFGVIR